MAIPFSDNSGGGSALADALREAVGPARVLADPESTAGYRTDWTGRWTGDAVVVRPGDTAQVAAVIRACAEHGAAIVPQGGNTGLVGGGVPRERSERPQVVLSLRALDEVGPVEGGTLLAGAGATLAAVQAAARAAGMSYGVDLGARDSATLGGTVSTDAGGLRVVAHGSTRAQLVSVQAVLADGSIADGTAAPAAGLAGYDLAQLLCGAEGTLGVVTAARVRLIPAPEADALPAFVGCRDVAEAVSLVERQRSYGGLLAAELVGAEALSLVCAGRGLPLPGPLADWPVWLLLEVEGGPDLPDDDRPALADDRVWAYREAVPEVLATLGPGHKLDVAVRPDQVPALAAAMAGAAAPYPVHVFGHLGVGNLHVTVVGADLTDDVDERILRVVADLGGSVAAEHGVGVAKTRWLPWSLGSAELAVMRAVKAALDPHQMFNPGVLLD
jgi:FAD/FMN-containing dehydrogenase